MNVFMVEEGHSCAKGGACTRGMQGASHRGEFRELDRLYWVSIMDSEKCLNVYSDCCCRGRRSGGRFQFEI
jgi:hypothetical protein